MNNLTKKILISLFTWILIFLTLGTSTFAWFSMNYSVEATDLRITVKSNSTYLLIGDNAEIATNKLGLGREVVAKYVAGGDENKRVFPAFYGDGTVLGSTTTVSGKWYTASNRNSDHPNDDVINVTEIIDNNLNRYLLTYKVWMTLSGDSLPYSKPLTITFDKQSGDDSLSIVVVLTTYTGTNQTGSTTEKFHLDSTNDQATTINNIYVSKDTAYEITIYAYINGNGDNVYSDYYTLHGISGVFNIDFDIVP